MAAYPIERVDARCRMLLGAATKCERYKNYFSSVQEISVELDDSEDV
jgi:hypothetical protein